MNRANGTAPRNAAPSASFYDAQSTALLLALAVLGCGPVWVLVFRSAFFYPVRNRSPLDTCIVWAQRAITFLAGFFFVQAAALFPPAFFVSSAFSAAAFVERDMAALKHIMHACFFFAGFKYFFEAGNAHPLEICRMIFVLTCFPSCVAAIFSTIDLWKHGIVSVVLLAWTGAVLTGSAAALTSRVLFLTYKDQRACQSRSEAVTSMYSRYRMSVSRLPMTGSNARVKSSAARGLLWLHVVALGLNNAMWLFRQPSDAPLVSLNQFGIAYVEALTMALHWGFVLGSGMHGVNFCSVSSLEIYLWGSFLLLVSALVDGGGIIGEPEASGVVEVFVVAARWLQTFAHAAGFAKCLSLYWLLKNGLGFSSRGDYLLLHHYDPYDNNAKGSGRGGGGGGGKVFSLWGIVRSGLADRKGTRRKSFRYYFFGQSLAVLSTCAVVVMVLEAAVTPWLFHFEGEALGHQALVRRAVGGMNFSLHATAVYYFAFYRSVRGLTKGGTTKWGALGFCMLGFVSFFQSFSLFLVHPAPKAYGTIVFNIFRVLLYVATVVSYVLFPSQEFAFFEAEEGEEVPLGPEIGRIPEGKEDGDVVGRTCQGAAGEDPDVNDEEVAQEEDVPTARKCCILKALRSALTLDMFDSKSDPEPRSHIDRLAVAMFYAYFVFAVIATVRVADVADALPKHSTDFSLGEHSIFFGLCFHFMCIVSSYALKGLRHKHLGYAVFSSLATLAFGVVATSAALAALVSSDLVAFVMFVSVGAGAVVLGLWMHAHWYRSAKSWHEAWVDAPPTFLV
jgi:hypothetical protein